jgi:hypothetical protein
MAKQEAIEFILQDSEFEVDSDGYFSGGVQYQLTNIPEDGLLVQGYLELKKDKSLALVSEISEGHLTRDDDTIYISVSGSLDGNALPDTFTLNYRIFTLWDSLDAAPKLPSSFGQQNLSISPKGLLGGKKWKCSGSNELASVMVHNDGGDFQISSNILMGKASGDDIGVVVEHVTDDTAEHFVIFKSPAVSIKNQYAAGAEKVKSRYRFFKPQKWAVLNKFNPLNVTRS